MEHPFARIVRNEGDVHVLARPHHHGVAPLLKTRFLAVDRDDSEKVAVQVHGMREVGFIDHVQDDVRALLEVKQRFVHQGMLVLCGVVHGPGDAFLFHDLIDF